MPFLWSEPVISPQPDWTNIAITLQDKVWDSVVKGLQPTSKGFEPGSISSCSEDCQHPAHTMRQYQEGEATRQEEARPRRVRSEPVRPNPHCDIQSKRLSCCSCQPCSSVCLDPSPKTPYLGQACARTGVTGTEGGPQTDTGFIRGRSR